MPTKGSTPNPNPVARLELTHLEDVADAGDCAKNEVGADFVALAQGELSDPPVASTPVSTRQGEPDVQRHGESTRGERSVPCARCVSHRIHHSVRGAS
jgi:hypothetical protein